MKNMISSILCCMALTGCATSYKPYSYFGGGGYKDVQLGENIFKVSVEANGYTTNERASNLALLRAADLTLQNGFRFFVVSSSEDNSYSSIYKAPTRTSVSVSGYGNTATASARTTGGQIYSYQFPVRSMIITCFKEKPDMQETIYDAEFLYNSMKKTLNVD